MGSRKQIACVLAMALALVGCAESVPIIDVQQDPGGVSGGSSGNGGATASGGSTGSGGTGSGGTGSGGTSTGGITGAGGTVAPGTGGAPGTDGRGGATGTGGRLGAAGAGGRAASGGGTGTGGASGTGGATSDGVVGTFTAVYADVISKYCFGSSCHNPGGGDRPSFASQASCYSYFKSQGQLYPGQTPSKSYI
jgi:hypothetical protein